MLEVLSIQLAPGEADKPKAAKAKTAKATEG